MGRRPYNGRDRKSIREEMLGREAKIPKSYESKMSKEGVDFVNRVLLIGVSCYRGLPESAWDTTESAKF